MVGVMRAAISRIRAGGGEGNRAGTVGLVTHLRPTPFKLPGKPAAGARPGLIRSQQQSGGVMETASAGEEDSRD